MDGRGRLQVGVEAALLAGVVGLAHGPYLGEPEPRDGVEQSRIDVPVGRVHDLGPGRGHHVRTRRGDAAVADDDGPHERLAGQGVHGAALDRIGLARGGGGGAEGDGGDEEDSGAEGNGGAEFPGGAQRAGVALGADGAGEVVGAEGARGEKRQRGPDSADVGRASHRSSSAFGFRPSFARWACFSAWTAAWRSPSSSMSKYSFPST